MFQICVGERRIIFQAQLELFQDQLRVLRKGQEAFGYRGLTSATVAVWVLSPKTALVLEETWVREPLSHSFSRHFRGRLLTQGPKVGLWWLSTI